MNSLHGARAAVDLNRPRRDLPGKRKAEKRRKTLESKEEWPYQGHPFEKKGFDQNPRLRRLVTGRAQCNGNHGERGGQA